MSRLAHHKLTGVDDAALISRDIINTIRYLRSKRLLKRNETVHVCIITPEPDKKTIEHNLSGEELIECFFIPLSQLKSTIGVRGDLPRSLVSQHTNLAIHEFDDGRITVRIRDQVMQGWAASPIDIVAPKVGDSLVHRTGVVQQQANGV